MRLTVMSKVRVVQIARHCLYPSIYAFRIRWFFNPFRGFLWLQEVWKDQLYRSFVGDRLYHSHDVLTTDAENTTLNEVIERNLGMLDLPLSVFTIPDIEVSNRPFSCNSF